MKRKNIQKAARAQAAINDLIRYITKNNLSGYKSSVKICNNVFKCGNYSFSQKLAILYLNQLQF